MNKEQRQKAVERTRQWRLKNKNIIKEYRHKEYIKNKEHYKEYNKKYYELNRDFKKECASKYYKNNRKNIIEKNKIYCKKYREEHKKQYAYYTRLRTYRVKGSIGSHTLEEWELLKSRYNYTCPKCKKSEPEIKLTEDHIVPVTKNGTSYIENIQPLCVNCNSNKRFDIIYYPPN
jgi:5-methylcytosine-specific restriction endonuclease McrA